MSATSNNGSPGIETGFGGRVLHGWLIAEKKGNKISQK
jgi:hypothetical protein